MSFFANAHEATHRDSRVRRCHLRSVGRPDAPSEHIRAIGLSVRFAHLPRPLAAEFASRNIEFSEPLKDTDDDLRGFELKDSDGYVLFFGRRRS
jgi:hypothetical protein